MSLPAHWIDRIFAQMTLAYGQSFIRQWEGLDLESVREYWAKELDGLSGESIAYGLSMLNPDKPPNALQFRFACQRAPEKPPVALPAPKPSEADKERVRKMLKQVRDRITGVRQ